MKWKAVFDPKKRKRSALEKEREGVYMQWVK